MADTLVIFLGITERQNNFWDSYHALDAGIDHDILIAYRDKKVVPLVTNKRGKVITEKKEYLGKDVPFQAFGGYRHFFNKYATKYKYFAFISDDVIARSDGWLKKAITPLNWHEKLGWTATQVYSKSAGPACPDHFKAPIWFAKSEALQKIDWVFDHDHVGEIMTANAFLKAGYFGIQVGNKFDLAYDSLEFKGYFEGDTIICVFEKKFFPEKNLRAPFSKKELELFSKSIWKSIEDGSVDRWWARSPAPHIGKRNFVTELQGLDGQVYLPSLPLAKKCLGVFEHKKYNIQVLKKCLPSRYQNDKRFLRSSQTSDFSTQLTDYYRSLRWYF